MKLRVARRARVGARRRRHHWIRRRPLHRLSRVLMIIKHAGAGRAGSPSTEFLQKSGGRDRSARLWKVAEESQLLYKGQAASMDTVRWVSDDAFVSGDDEGYVSRRGCKHENAKTKTHKITNPHARRLRGAHAETCAFGMSTRKRRQ